MSGDSGRRRPSSDRLRHRRSVRTLGASALLATLALGAAACGSGGAEMGGGSGAGMPVTAAPTTTTTVPIEARPVRVTAAPWSLATAIQREGLVTDGTSIFLAGGLDRSSVSQSAVLKIDPANGASAQVGTLAVAVHDTQAVWRDGTIVVVGGGSPPIRTEVQSVVPGGAAKVIGQLPHDRADHVVAQVGSTLYALGGVDQASNLDGTVAASTDGGVTWKQVGTLAQAVRYSGVGVLDGQIYLLGGVASASGADTAAIQRFDPKTNQTTVVGQLPQAFSHPTSVQMGPLVFLAGGFVANARVTKVQRVDLRSLTTVDTGAVLPAPMSDGAGVVIGGTAYLVGGEGSDGKASTAVSLLTLG